MAKFRIFKYSNKIPGSYRHVAKYVIALEELLEMLVRKIFNFLLNSSNLYILLLIFINIVNQNNLVSHCLQMVIFATTSKNCYRLVTLRFYLTRFVD